MKHVLKSFVSVGRVAKVAAVAIVFIAITWQARVQHQSSSNGEQSILTQQAGMIPQDWAKHRKAQVKELTRVMPNRFALSKAYYDTDETLLESVEAN